MMIEQPGVTRMLRAGIAGSSGVCLVEVMLSLTMGAVVLAAFLDTFNGMHRQTVQQQRTIANQQDLRLGLEVFEQEARLATASSIVTASADEFLFNANINAQYTTMTLSAAPGQVTLSVEDGSGWGIGKSVMLCSPVACEVHRLSRSGQRHQLFLVEPVGQLFPAGASVEVINRVVYYTKREDKSGLLTLMRMVDGGAGTLMGGLDHIKFLYCDEFGVPTSIASRITRVVIDVKLARSSLQIVKEVSLRS